VEHVSGGRDMEMLALVLWLIDTILMLSMACKFSRNGERSDRATINSSGCNFVIKCLRQNIS